MRIVLDVLGSTAKSGGMRLHATEMVRAWASEFPSDELYVVGPEWAVNDFSQICNVRVKLWPNEATVMRVLGQMLFTPLVYASRRAAVALSFSPPLSPLLPRSRSMCVVHDWRHLRQPGEFGTLQKIYREVWERSVRRASLVACISRKTERETLELCPAAHTTVIENGTDHPSRWGQLPTEPSAEFQTVVTFGHQTNKRPDLVIRALAHARMINPKLKLVVLGARGDLRTSLRQLATSVGVEEYVELPGFVSERDYRIAIVSAAAIVLASTDEGFGLPIGEARYLGIPAVVAEGSGLAQLHGGWATVATATPEGIGAGICEAIDTQRVGADYTARTWRDTVRDTRAAALAAPAAHILRLD